jgi:hypothetical protein
MTSCCSRRDRQPSSSFDIHPFERQPPINKPARDPDAPVFEIHPGRGAEFHVDSSPIRRDEQDCALESPLAELETHARSPSGARPSHPPHQSWPKVRDGWVGRNGRRRQRARVGLDGRRIHGRRRNENRGIGLRRVDPRPADPGPQELFEGPTARTHAPWIRTHRLISRLYPRFCHGHWAGRPAVPRVPDNRCREKRTGDPHSEILAHALHYRPVRVKGCASGARPAAGG